MADGLPSMNLLSNVGVEDKNGALWVATTDAGVVNIEDGKVVKVYTERDGLPGNAFVFVTGARFGVLCKDKQGAVWLTDLETMRNQLIGSNVPEPITTLGNAKVYEDREGNLWFATTREGLFRARAIHYRILDHGWISAEEHLSDFPEQR